MNEEWIREQVAARDSLEDALAQSRRAAAFAVTMARTVGTLADAVQRVLDLCDERERGCERANVPISSAHLSPAAVRSALRGRALS